MLPDTLSCGECDTDSALFGRSCLPFLVLPPFRWNNIHFAISSAVLRTQPDPHKCPQNLQKCYYIIDFYWCSFKVLIWNVNTTYDVSCMYKMYHHEKFRTIRKKMKFEIKILSSNYMFIQVYLSIAWPNENDGISFVQL